MAKGDIKRDGKVYLRQVTYRKNSTSRNMERLDRETAKENKKKIDGLSLFFFKIYHEHGERYLKNAILLYNKQNRNNQVTYEMVMKWIRERYKTIYGEKDDEEIR